MATVIRRLLNRLRGHTQSRFQRDYRRHGQLFQNRCRSFLCEEEVYLKESVRYIHLNPLRSQQMQDLKALNKYQWCGHGALLGKFDAGFQDTAYDLGLFSHSTRQARRAYESFVSEGVKQGRRPELVGGSLVRSVGGWSARNGNTP